MTKPYIICHMMMSVDGRIDCNMTIKIKGSNEYYQTLAQLDTQANLSGRGTAELELANKGEFKVKDITNTFNKESFSKKRDSNNYQIVVDTKGKLLWNDNINSSDPLIIVLTKNVSKEYIKYLDSLNISWITSGDNKIDLKKASEILYKEFNIKRMVIVGGGTINGAFLDNGLLDEISILIGPGIDGRSDMKAVFDGLPKNREPYQLKLKDAITFNNGSIWIRYLTTK